MSPLRLAAFILLTIPFARLAHARQAESFELPLGWSWECEPTELRPQWTRQGQTRLTGDGALSVYATLDGSVIASLVSRAGATLPRRSDQPEYRPYLFGADGEPLKSLGWSAMSSGELSVTTSTFECDDPASVTSFGLAVLTFEGRQERSAAAMTDAEASGAHVLPLPIVGAPLDFELPVFERRAIRSEDLRGKVVLIDCWATWCGPCMQKMPKLKAAREHFGDDLVVIGVNFDDDPETLREAIAEHGFDWPQVHAATAARGDDTLWERAADIHTLPRLFLIDRNGVLRDDFFPHDLIEQIAPVVTATTSGSTG